MEAPFLIVLGLLVYCALLCQGTFWDEHSEWTYMSNVGQGDAQYSSLGANLFGVDSAATTYNASVTYDPSLGYATLRVHYSIPAPGPGDYTWLWATFPFQSLKTYPVLNVSNTSAFGDYLSVFLKNQGTNDGILFKVESPTVSGTRYEDEHPVGVVSDGQWRQYKWRRSDMISPSYQPVKWEQVRWWTVVISGPAVGYLDMALLTWSTVPNLWPHAEMPSFFYEPTVATTATTEATTTPSSTASTTTSSITTASTTTAVETSTSDTESASVGGEEEGGFPVAVVAGAAGGSVCLCVVIAVIGFVVFRRRKSKSNNQLNQLTELPTRPASLDYVAMHHPVEQNGYPEETYRPMPMLGMPQVSPTPSSYPPKKHFNWEIDYDELIVKEEVGRGAFGKVFRGEFRSQEVAIKKLLGRELSDHQLEEFTSEAELYASLRPHGNVVQVFGICTHPEKPMCIVTEFCEKGSLWDLLQKANFTVKEKINFAIDCCKGMSHLHKEQLVHRDLAARNLLVNQQNKVKVSDFGMSRVNESGTDSNTTKSDTGPLKWMPPESILYKQYGYSSDVWAFGVVLFEIFEVAVPYKNLNPLAAAIAVSRDGIRLISASAPKAVSAVMTQCFAENPQARPSFQALQAKLETIVQQY